MPDRTQALSAVGEGSDAPLEALASGLDRLDKLGACAVAIACNTAHAWHAALQVRFPRIELLHVAREVALHLQSLGVREVGLLATQGTYRSALYEIAERLMARHGDIVLIMGCTEIPLALPSASQAARWTLVNPAQVLARHWHAGLTRP